jgi:hypothetical protein
MEAIRSKPFDAICRCGSNRAQSLSRLLVLTPHARSSVPTFFENGHSLRKQWSRENARLSHYRGPKFAAEMTGALLPKMSSSIVNTFALDPTFGELGVEE